MNCNSKLFSTLAASGENGRNGVTPGPAALFSPPKALRILHRRTGEHVSRSTFYRWVDSGKVYSLRIGSRIYIPWKVLEETIQKCLEGEPL